MSKFLAALGLSTALAAATALPLATQAQAAMSYGGPGVADLQHQIAPVEKAQFFSGADIITAGIRSAGTARAGTGAATPGITATAGAAAMAGTAGATAGRAVGVRVATRWSVRRSVTVRASAARIGHGARTEGS